MSVEERKKRKKVLSPEEVFVCSLAWSHHRTQTHSCTLLLAAGASCGGGVEVLKEEGDLPRL